MNYDTMKEQYIQGWHTWNVRSVLSHVHMPDGLALNLGLQDPCTGSSLPETLIGRYEWEMDDLSNLEVSKPGLHAFDDSYTEMTVQWRQKEVHVESAVDGEDILLLITPSKQSDKPLKLTVEVTYLWNRPGNIIRKEDTILAENEDGTCEIRNIGSSDADQKNTFVLVLDSPVAVYTGQVRSLEEICQKISAAKVGLLQNQALYKEETELYQALECAAAWAAIYDPTQDRVISPVSRPWSIRSGGYIIFCWDNFFAAFMSGLGSKELAYTNYTALINGQKKYGFVPNCMTPNGDCKDHSQPPVGSTMILETYRQHRDKWILEESYPALLSWNTWYTENRMTKSGALCWGSSAVPGASPDAAAHADDWQAAAWESGLDNSPMFDDVPYNKTTHLMELEDVGLSGLYIMDCCSLIELAKELGRTEDIPLIRERMQQAEQGLEGLWDEDFGMYLNRRTDTGELSRRMSPTNFYALFSPSVPKERVDRITEEHYYNPEEFYGEWMLPSATRNDPGYGEDYWRGRIWGPMNFLVYLAFCHTDRADVREDLAEKSRKLFMKEWKEHGHVHENYSSITGDGCGIMSSDKFYHWGALLSAIALAEAGKIPEFGKPLK